MIDHLAIKNPYSRDAAITFDEEPHIYTVNGSNNYLSVTTWCHSHFEPFNAEKTIQRMMASPKWPNNKYFGQTPKEIAAGWKKYGKEAASAGTIMHKMIEKYYQLGEFKEPLSCTGPELELFKEFIQAFSDLTPYRAEWMIWDDALQLAGSIDMVFQKPNGDLVIYDWKRCKDIRKSPMMNSFSKTPCISHIPDTNYWHYALQLNTYKGLLEKNYGLELKELALVQLHPKQTKYRVISLPNLQEEVRDLFALRLTQLERLK